MATCLPILQAQSFDVWIVRVAYGGSVFAFLDMLQAFVVHDAVKVLVQSQKPFLVVKLR